MSEAALTDSTAPIESIQLRISIWHPVYICQAFARRDDEAKGTDTQMARRTTLGDLGTLTGQLDKDDISQSLLGVLGDTNDTDVGLRLKSDPFMVSSVLGCGSGPVSHYNLRIDMVVR